MLTQPTLTPDAEYTLIRRALRGDAPANDAERRRFNALRYAFEYELTHKQVDAVALRYIKQMTLERVAAELGCSITAVFRRLEWARIKFARALEMAG